MSIPGTAGSEDTLGEWAALLTDAVSDQLGPVGLPAHVSHHVLGVADVLAQQAGSVHRQSVALPVAGAVGAGEAGVSFTYLLYIIRTCMYMTYNF